MSTELVKKLRQLQHSEVNPRPDWTAKNRSLLLSQISNTLPVKTQATLPQRWTTNVWSRFEHLFPQPLVTSVVRPLSILMVAILVGTSGWIATVDAAYETLPGEPMYVLKRAAEKTQLVVASLIGGDQAVTRVHVELAKRRAEEAKKILRNDNGADVAQVVATVNDLKNEINTVNKKLDETQQNATGTVALSADVVKDVKQNTEQITQVLKDVKDNLLVNNATTTDERLLSQEVNEAKDLVKDVSVKAVAVIVAKHLDGDPAVSKEDAKAALDTTLQSAASDVAEQRQTVAGVKTLVENAKTEIHDLASELKKQNSNAMVVSSTQNISAQVTSAANQAVAAVLKTEAVSAAVDKTVTEVKQLLNNDDLAKAIDKVKEVSQASKVVEKISDSSLMQAQAVLPIVQVITNGDSSNVAVSSSVVGQLNILTVTSSAVTSGTTTVSAKAPTLK